MKSQVAVLVWKEWRQRRWEFLLCLALALLCLVSAVVWSFFHAVRIRRLERYPWEVLGWFYCLLMPVLFAMQTACGDISDRTRAFSRCAAHLAPLGEFCPTGRWRHRARDADPAGRGYRDAGLRNGLAICSGAVSQRRVAGSDLARNGLAECGSFGHRHDRLLYAIGRARDIRPQRESAGLAGSRVDFSVGLRGGAGRRPPGRLVAAVYFSSRPGDGGGFRDARRWFLGSFARSGPVVGPGGKPGGRYGVGIGLHLAAKSASPRCRQAAHWRRPGFAVRRGRLPAWRPRPLARLRSSQWGALAWLALRQSLPLCLAAIAISRGAGHDDVLRPRRKRSGVDLGNIRGRLHRDDGGCRNPLGEHCRSRFGGR